MRFHCLGVPHTVSNADYVACAYTQKVVKFCKMMKARGHHVIHYGHEDSVVECDEHVTVLTNEDFDRVYGHHDYKKSFFKFDVNDEVYTTFYKNSIEAIAVRKEKHDFILPFWGSGVRPVCDAHQDLICVEPGIGYAGGHWARWKVFESYAIYHAYYGLSAVGTCKQDWYDVVIPNYFDSDDFTFSAEKDDYFLFVGRIYEGKGVHIAIQITEKIGAKLLVCGQGSIEDLGYKEIPKHVTHIGYVGKEQRKELMSKAKGAFVISMYCEPFGGVQMEMLMSGTPTITTDWGAFTENNIHGVTGYRCRTFEQFCWAAKNIDRINPEKCREWAMNFSLEKVSKMYEEYFNMVMNVYASEGWYTKNTDRESLNWLNKYPEKIKWYTFYTSDYKIWHDHLKSKLHDKFDFNGIHVDNLNIHNQHNYHHFTGSACKVKLVIDAIKNNLGKKIVFSDCTLYLQNVEKLQNIISCCKKTTYAKNSTGSDINIGLIVLICDKIELKFWNDVLMNMNSDVTDQDVVNKLIKTHPHDTFDRNYVFCNYITEQNKHVIPSQFCVLKLYTESNADKYNRFIQRLNTLTMLNLKL